VSTEKWTLVIRDNGTGNVPPVEHWDSLPSLGLNLVRRQVFGMRGALGVDSNARGTRITITFPVSASEQAR
jgi:two-component sensor histidine kinase